MDNITCLRQRPRRGGAATRLGLLSGPARKPRTENAAAGAAAGTARLSWLRRRDSRCPTHASDSARKSRDSAVTVAAGPFRGLTALAAAAAVAAAVSHRAVLPSKVADSGSARLAAALGRGGSTTLRPDRPGLRPGRTVTSRSGTVTALAVVTVVTVIT